jgi:hypothetical protein
VDAEIDRKLSVVANVRYQTPPGNGAKKLKGLMRYLQYRNDRDGHIPQKHGQERWIDLGLSNNFQTIASNCESLKFGHVQAFTFVINPAPDLVAMIPERRHGAFVRALTEATIDRFFEARGIDDVPYSYVVHHRETTDADRPGRANPHAHIILPGTYYSWADGSYVPLYYETRTTSRYCRRLPSRRLTCSFSAISAWTGNCVMTGSSPIASV